MIDCSNKTLFILLHGYGSNGEHLEDIGKNISEEIENCEVICPNAPFVNFNKTDCYEWFPITQLKEDHFLEGLRNIFPFIENYIEEKIKNGYKAHNIILGGFSQGACVAVYTALRLKIKIKCAISFSGGLVDYNNSLSQEMQNKVPVCLIHGTQDRIIPAAFSERAKRILEKNDISVEINLIENLPHIIDRDCIKCCVEFIKKLK